jgi:hypothetical protein
MNSLPLPSRNYLQSGLHAFMQFNNHHLRFGDPFVIMIGKNKFLMHLPTSSFITSSCGIPCCFIIPAMETALKEFAVSGGTSFTINPIRHNPDQLPAAMLPYSRYPIFTGTIL